jgi:hypothetical protein
MRLHKKTLDDLAEMICGRCGNGSFHRENFVYRTSRYLTEFFQNCNLSYQHSEGTRKWWVKEVLEEVDAQPATHPQLPSPGVLAVIRELLDVGNFLKREYVSVNGIKQLTERDDALDQLNDALGRDGLEAYFDANNQCRVKRTGTAISSENMCTAGRSWTAAEHKFRDEWETFLEICLEDEFLEKVLAPLFRQLNYQRVAVPGHKDKALEFGKDLWMRYQLPTGHFIYFGLQAKRGKIDASASGRNENVATLLRQAHMMLGDPIFDADANRKVLLDHIYIAASGDITKAARRYMVDQLDEGKRRHLIFLDRSVLLDLLVDSRLPRPSPVDIF